MDAAVENKLLFLILFTNSIDRLRQVSPLLSGGPEYIPTFTVILLMFLVLRADRKPQSILALQGEENCAGEIAVWLRVWASTGA